MPDHITMPVGLNILILDDEANIRRTLALCLEAEGYHVSAVGNPDDALAEISRQVFDLVFLDLRLGTLNGLDLISSFRAQCPWLRIVVITAYASIDTAVAAMRQGATDYLPKPFTPAQVTLLTKRIAETRALELKVAHLQDTLGRVLPDVDLNSSHSPAMQSVLHLAHQVAGTDATILVRGESGTGKNVLTRAIHAWSKRAHKPLGTVSCPALSAELLESELFGHVRGAFTSAVRDNPGRIAMCDGGTLFLDEIGDLPTRIQPKLLRFIQDREYERLGEATTRHADLRVITATNQDLQQAVRHGQFREDLLYRLNVIQIEIPPLRQRPEDILPLAERLMAFFNKQNHRNILGFTPAAAEAMQRYTWPGNVRELRNVVERCAILCPDERVGLEHLPPIITNKSPGLEDAHTVMLPLEKVEELHIRRVLAATRSLEEASHILQIDAATLWRKRKRYGV